jgi:transcriptional regulator of NAD metabolism
MEGEQRREQILQILATAKKPVSGGELSKMLNVSRQVVVQDIALLRASDKPVLSGTKGYQLPSPRENRCRRTFFVSHSDAQTEEELNLIVDNGGKVLDVVVEHEIYGQISAGLMIENRRDVQDFIQKLHQKNARPLNSLTNGKHFHTVEADSEATLDRIEAELREKHLISF